MEVAHLSFKRPTSKCLSLVECLHHSQCPNKPNNWKQKRRENKWLQQVDFVGCTKLTIQDTMRCPGHQSNKTHVSSAFCMCSSPDLRCHFALIMWTSAMSDALQSCCVFLSATMCDTCILTWPSSCICLTSKWACLLFCHIWFHMLSPLALSSTVDSCTVLHCDLSNTLRTALSNMFQRHHDLSQHRWPIDICIWNSASWCFIVWELDACASVKVKTCFGFFSIAICGHTCQLTGQLATP